MKLFWGAKLYGISVDRDGMGRFQAKGAFQTKTRVRGADTKRFL